MALWQMPDGIRVEHALQSGSEIPPFYDSMIAKLISHGADRNEARGRLICGLEQTAAFGVTTNQGFLISCLRHPGFAQGEATTAFIGEHRDELLAPRADDNGGSRACGVAALRHQSACAAVASAARSLAATVPADDCGSISAAASHEVDIVRERDGGYRRGRQRRRTAFRDRRARPAIAIRFRTDGLMESANSCATATGSMSCIAASRSPVRDLTLAAPVSAAATAATARCARR